ncbi:exo-beta-N-acetylmuramidase NamZ domain-containing protein [Allorhodopirellula solitaria]|uniref:Penicillin-binding protein 4 n=1 Tax=Allorhodopirellula solitaria TaxID=2527987 RepID=A0A5C5YJY6_9BACT|nr:exo-beta-N-acetylmuramidase NamZ domain-containing protein [Allorhodopirellula solitaria]TWT75216.1 Penicillin-binding protein 4* [Allorhodopirellula solitaria]
MMLDLRWTAVFAFAILLISLDEARSQGLSASTAAPVGMQTERLAAIEGLMSEGISQGRLPGGVVCFGRQGEVMYLEAFGNRQLGDAPEAMTVDTVFDLASLTKPVATATSIMKLVENGELLLRDKVVDHLPEFAPYGKDEITVQDLLLHESGLIPDNAMADYQNGPEVAWEKICQLKLVSPIGERFRYSDVNFIVLAKLVERVTGKSIDVFSQDELFAPLGMDETGYNPPESLKHRAAPTQKRDGDWMRGEVHDPRAHALSGVAGHAGLFSTATDIAVYAQMMLGNGSADTADGEARVLSPATVSKMTAAYRVSSGIRGLGWDKQTAYSSNRGDLLSSSAFGHGGFTGTVLWIDPELDLFFVFLSNRVHPDGRGSVNHLAGKILNVVVSSLVEQPRRVTHDVQPGIDVLLSNGFRALANQRVGLITNHTGRSADGTSTASILQSAPEVALTALFSPEHGIAGRLDHSNIANTKDDQTGLPVFSLYGETRRPTPEMLAEIDTLVFDIQDIGTRFYTYISTMGEAMVAAAEAKKRFVVLDRPNPLGGLNVTGPMLDEGKESFVGYTRLPVQHGMTIGEIAQLIRAEHDLDLDLEVIQCQGWQRSDSWDETGLTWINPSPNMRNLTQAFLYPGIGLIETTNVSVGRGTDTPFEAVGAPWIDGRELARHLNERELPGVRFVPIQFTPDASKYSDQLCGGIQIMVTELDQLNAVRVGLELATALHQLYPDDWQTKSLNRLLGNDQVYDSITDGDDAMTTWMKSLSGVSQFRASRPQYLLYE